MKNGEFENLVRWIKDAGNAQVDREVTEKAITKTRDLILSHRAQNSSFLPSLRKGIVMTSKVAAVLVPVVLTAIWLSSWQAESFAGDVKREVAETRCISFETRDGNQRAASPTKIMLLGPYRERRVTPNGDVVIRDISKGVMLILNPKLKTALRIESGTGNGLTLYDYVRNIDESKTEHLPERILDGQHVSGFRSVEDQEHINIATTVWADPKSRLPVHIERTWTDSKTQNVIREVLTNFKYDESPDKSLFALTAPDGYSIEEKKANPSQSNFVVAEDSEDDE